MNRRDLLLSVPFFLAAPSIVRATTLMPISVEWTSLEELLLATRRNIPGSLRVVCGTSPARIGGLVEYVELAAGTLNRWDALHPDIHSPPHILTEKWLPQNVETNLARGRRIRGASPPWSVYPDWQFRRLF